MLSLEFRKPRLQQFGSGKNKIKILPGEKVFIDEKIVSKLFDPKSGDPTIEHYRASGDLVIFDETRREWMPDGAEPSEKGFGGVAREPEEQAEVEQIDPGQKMGGGVPGGSAKECKDRVAECTEEAQLRAWLAGESRGGVKKAIEKRLEELA